MIEKRRLVASVYDGKAMIRSRESFEGVARRVVVPFVSVHGLDGMIPISLRQTDSKRYCSKSSAFRPRPRRRLVCFVRTRERERETEQFDVERFLTF